MSAIQRQYLFGLIFLGIGVYYLTQHVTTESCLYLAAGLAFIVNGLTVEPKLIRYKKLLTVFSWTLIIITGLLLLYVVQFHWF